VRAAFLPLCVSFLVKHPRPEILSTAPKYMPEVLTDSTYDFKKMLESCPQEL
jgi:hypothetical protein